MSDLLDVEHSINRVEKALNRVEDAVKSSGGPSWILGAAYGLFMVIAVSGSIDSAWHSKWRYAVRYGVDTNRVYVSKKPHDCDFLAAPIGAKYCGYDPNVSTTRWAKSTKGEPIVSYDDGKTWSVFTPDANVTVPQYSTVKEVDVSWEKKEKDF